MTAQAPLEPAFSGTSLYRAKCTSPGCRSTWLFWEHRGIAEGLVFEYVGEQCCDCGEPYEVVSVEHGFVNYPNGRV